MNFSPANLLLELGQVIIVLKNIFQKAGKFLIITSYWLLLCGIDRSPKQSNFGLKDLQTKNMLQAMPHPSEIPLSFYLLATAFIASVVSAILLVRFLHKKKIKEGLEQITEDRVQLSVDSQFEARQVEVEDRDFLKKICNTKDPEVLLPVIMSAKVFEKTVEDYKKSPNFSKSDLEKIFLLRKSLQFTFKNTDAEFIRTQMLEPGTHLECAIHHKGKNVVFTTSILDSTEEQLLIKPPRVNKRPANMKQFSELFCNIRRGKDADYEFKFKIIGQLARDLNAVVLSHTSNIKKLQIRISERLPMDLEMDFLLVTAANYEMIQDFEVGNQPQHALSGIIKDMSAGGIKVQIGELPTQGINKGDVFLFHLPYASLRGNLAATVLVVASRGGRNEIHLAFRDIDMLTHMKLNQYMHRRKVNMEAA